MGTYFAVLATQSYTEKYQLVTYYNTGPVRWGMRVTIIESYRQIIALTIVIILSSPRISVILYSRHSAINHI